jgi:hypothetical protein
MTDDIKVLTESITQIIKYVGDLSLRIEACRILLRDRGVTDDEYDVTYNQLKRHQNWQAGAFLSEVLEKENAERIRRLLESPEGTKH